MKPFFSRVHPSLRPILLGVALFAVFNILLTLAVTFSPVNRKFNYSYGNYLPQKMELMARHDPKKVNILFLGTSQTNNGFIPDIFDQAAAAALRQPNANIDSFNLGLPNNRYDIMQAYLDYHVHRYGAPKLVLIELSPSTQEVDSYYYYLPALYYRTLIEKSPKQAAEFLNYPYLAWNVKKELLLAAFSSLYQYRHTFSPLNILDKSTGKIKKRFSGNTAAAESGASAPTAASVPVDPAWMEKGWHPYEQSPNMKTPEGVRLSVREAKAYYIDHQKTVRFDKLGLLVAYCKRRGIPVALVAWPQHPAFTEMLQQSDLGKRYAGGLRQLAAREGVPLINLNDQLPKGNHPGFFADPRHLTPDGAYLFSGVLARELFAADAIKRRFEPERRLSRL